MHIREVVSKNYSPRGNFLKLPRVDNFTNDLPPNVHYLFYKMVFKIWAVVSKN